MAGESKKRFIYTIGEANSDKLLSLGFKLLKYDKHAGVFVFANDEVIALPSTGIAYSMSDTMIF